MDKAERLNNQLEKLVMDNYHVFIQNITCSSIVSDQVKLREGVVSCALASCGCL